MSRPFTARLAAHGVPALDSWPRAMSAASGDRDDEEVEDDDAPLSPADEKQRPNPNGIRSAAAPSDTSTAAAAPDDAAPATSKAHHTVGRCRLTLSTPG
jgi:hypothetical protein